MNFFIFGRYILYFICIYLIQITNENEQVLLERYKNSVYLLLTRINKIIDNFSLTFEYNKYNITFNNFKILKPFTQNLSMNKETNEKDETFITIGDIMTTFEANVFIQLFTQKDELIDMKPIFFELFFDEIKFKIINNFEVQFFSSNVETLTYKQLDKLNFFSDFNNKIKCIFYEDEKEPIILDDMDSKLTEILKKKFDQKIIEKQNNINILTYDMIKIFDNNPFKFLNYSFNYVNDLSLKKINLDGNDIIINHNSINIKYFSITGKFQYIDLNYDFFNFDMQCRKDRVHFIFKYNKNGTEIKFDIDDCIIDDDSYLFDSVNLEYHRAIKTIIKNYYANYLKEKADEYYNNIFGDI